MENESRLFFLFFTPSLERRRTHPRQPHPRQRVCIDKLGIDIWEVTSRGLELFNDGFELGEDVRGGDL